MIRTQIFLAGESSFRVPIGVTKLLYVAVQGPNNLVAFQANRSVLVDTAIPLKIGPSGTSFDTVNSIIANVLNNLLAPLPGIVGMVWQDNSGGPNNALSMGFGTTSFIVVQWEDIPRRPIRDARAA